MTKKPTEKFASYEAPTDEPLAITPLEYGGLQQAFAFLNGRLFDGALPNVFITLSRHAKSGGHFAPDRLTKRGSEECEHEINLNPDIFTVHDDEFIVSILAHEMTHLWQHVCGTPPKRVGYHDRQWSAQMESLGLRPSSTGMVGGRATGSRMGHYILEGGPYQLAFRALAATGWKLHLQSTPRPGESRGPNSKTKFTCPGCGANAWGKPDLQIACIPCGLRMLPRDAAAGPRAVAGVDVPAGQPM